MPLHLKKAHSLMVEAGMADWYKTVLASRRAAEHVIDGLHSANDFTAMRHVLLCEQVSQAITNGLFLYELARDKGMPDTCDRILDEITTLARANEVLLQLSEELIMDTAGEEHRLALINGDQKE